MSRSRMLTIGVVGLVIAITAAKPSLAQPAMLQLDRLDKLAGQATEVVDIRLDASMIREASSLITGKTPETAQTSKTRVDLERAKVAVAAAQRKYDRTKELFEKRLIAKPSLEAAETDLQDAKADLAAATAAAHQAPGSIGELMGRLKGVYVKSLKFARAGVYSGADAGSLRAQLKAPWSRIVDIDNRPMQERVELYLWRDGDQSGGIAVLVTKPRELTVVNIIGSVELSELTSLDGIPGIPQALDAMPKTTPRRVF